MAELRVSVVIPARDDARALDECLRALSRQSVPPLEVVVVDNASTDDTAAVAAAYGARVVPEPSVGIPAAAATGYDAARGDVIARLDADSLPPPDWVARVTQAMAARPRPDAVTGTGVFCDAPPGLRRPLAAAYLGAYYLLGMAAAGHHVLWGSAMAMRREAWLEVRAAVHRDDPEVHDDMDLALALGPAARIRLVPSLVVGVSARSLVGGAQLRRRFRRAFHTLELNWAVAPPWQRWAVTLRRWRAPVASDPSRTPPGAGNLPRPEPRMRTTDAPDEVVLLDEHGKPIGTAARSGVHHEATPLHLAFSCYLYDDEGRVLLTRRALVKRTWPGVWTNSFCGHPRPGEDLADAVRRHARHELGVEVADIRPLLPDFRYRAVDASGTVENEVCPVFVARTPDVPAPHPEEVAEHRWLTVGEVHTAASAAPWALSPWMLEQLREVGRLPGTV